MPKLLRNRIARWLRWPVSSLRAYQVAVIVIATVPLACFTLLLLQRQVVAARAERQAALYRLVNSFALVVERELASSRDALTLLSHDAALQRGDIEAFRQNLLRWPLARRSWSAVALFDAEGRIVFSTRPLDAGAWPPSEGPADGPGLGGVTGAQPAGRGGQAGQASQWATSVDVPVQLPTGRMRLGARIPTAQWQALIAQTSVPPDGFLSLVDNASRVVAISHAPERYVGQLLPVERQAELLREAEPRMRLAPRASQPVVTLQRVPATTWWVGAGMTAVEPAWLEIATLSSALLAGLLSLAFGSVLALAVARRVSEPLRKMAQSGAGAVGPGIVVREIAALRDALRHADEQRSQAMQALQGRADEYQALLKERLALMEREQAARQSAEQASRGKDEFLAMLSHELRNPLSAIGAAVEVINRVDPKHPTAESARRVIGRQTQQLVGLMNDLTDMARATAGKIVIARQPLNLARLVLRTHAALRLAGRFQHHALTLDLHDVWIDADAMRIEQVVGNLLTNAAKYTPADGRITVELRAVDGEAVLQVQDNGMGIPAALLPRVFDMFVQGERGQDRRQPGLGLGLALVRRLVELHGGTVQASSPGNGEGSRFTVRLAATRTGPHVPTCRPLMLLGLGEAALAPIEALLEHTAVRVTLATEAPAALACLRGDAHCAGALVVVEPSALLPECGAGLLALRDARAGLRLVALVDDTGPVVPVPPGFDAALAKPLGVAALRAELSIDPFAALAS